MEQKPSRLKRLLYYILLCLFCMFLVEAFLSIAFHYKYGNNKLAIVDFFISAKSRVVNSKLNGQESEVQFRNQQLIRNGKADELSKEIVQEMAAANAFEFDPWLQFRNIDVTSKHVNTTGFIRKSIPSFVAKGIDTFRVWFFGGSTMWGFNVTDDETIPAKFAQLYSQAAKYKKSLEVSNYGVRSYYSFQEMKLLQDRLLYEQTPDLVIFLDGLNDVVFYPAPLHREPFYSGFLREYFKGNFPFARGKNVTDSIERYYIKDQNRSAKEKANILLNNYSLTTETVSRTAKAYAFNTLFVWQPVPYYNYSNQLKDPFCDKDSFPVYAFLNPAIETNFKKMNNSLYLANMLDGSVRFPFIDRVHYSPEMNTAIADSILQKIDSLLIN
ncbi:lysophospholipase L1-like esterase [Lacibacter cauensis]|uniref:Lysophospholipase L1-like esterase n=1 Tax=Lacibacter cauensis TaxID=510947 RepID=A0A562SQT6_9BACT|nr:SGNH/GDSL hydrolase family protein [Lacibacter cauensis]TWI83508.1 lysophospholipase L1-like esterase [Lacibacter cauensis]